MEAHRLQSVCLNITLQMTYFFIQCLFTLFTPWDSKSCLIDCIKLDVFSFCQEIWAIPCWRRWLKMSCSRSQGTAKFLSKVEYFIHFFCSLRVNSPKETRRIIWFGFHSRPKNYGFFRCWNCRKTDRRKNGWIQPLGMPRTHGNQ